MGPPSKTKKWTSRKQSLLTLWKWNSTFSHVFKAQPAMIQNKILSSRNEYKRKTKGKKAQICLGNPIKKVRFYLHLKKQGFTVRSKGGTLKSDGPKRHSLGRKVYCTFFDTFVLLPQKTKCARYRDVIIILPKEGQPHANERDWRVVCFVVLFYVRMIRSNKNLKHFYAVKGVEYQCVKASLTSFPKSIELWLNDSERPRGCWPDLNEKLLFQPDLKVVQRHKR